VHRGKTRVVSLHNFAAVQSPVWPKEKARYVGCLRYAHGLQQSFLWVTRGAGFTLTTQNLGNRLEI